jgi:hypothetical protein
MAFPFFLQIGSNKRRFTMARHLSHKRTFHPKLEALEERYCPAHVDYFHSSGGALHILGTQRADRIQIIDYGQGRVGVKAAGRKPGVFRDVHRVEVQARDGNDVVGYKLLGGAGTAPADLAIDLGRGNDTLSLDAPGVHVAAAKLWGVSVNASQGDDLVEFKLGTVEGDASVKVELGDGNDRFLDSFPTDSGIPTLNRLEGRTDVLVHAGDGNDEVMVKHPDPLISELHFTAALGQGDDVFHCATGDVARGVTVQIEAQGEEGNDTFDVRAGGEQEPFRHTSIDGALKQRLDGGSGRDIAAVTFMNADVNGEFSWGCDLGGDADQVSLNFAHVLANGRMDWDLNLGDGDNVAAADLADVTVNGEFIWFMPTGWNRDQVSLNFANVLVNGRMGWDIGLGGGNNTFQWNARSLDVLGSLTIRGSYSPDGDDQVGFIFTGGRIAAGASVDVGVNTGGGRDMLNFTLKADIARDARVVVKLDAGAGDDDVTFILPFIPGVPFPADASADGGTGFDVFRGTRDVRLTNFEQVIPMES